MRLTTNLKLKVADDLTADAVFNLERIDLIGSSITVGSDGTVKLLSASDILIQPESTSVGGDGTTGVVSIERSVQIENSLLLKDTASAFYLNPESTSLGTFLTQNRKLVLSQYDRDTTLSLAGDLTLTSITPQTEAFGLSLLLGATSVLTIQETGTAALLDSTQAFTNKDLTDASNTFSIDLATSVTNTLGLTNGGTGQTTANSSLNALLPTQTGLSGRTLKTDGTDTSWELVSGAGSNGVGFDWTTDLTKTFTHSFGTTDVLVEVYDNDTGETILTEVTRTNLNDVQTITTGPFPSSGFRVLIKQL